MCYPGKPVLYFCNRIVIFRLINIHKMINLWILTAVAIQANSQNYLFTVPYSMVNDNEV